MKTKILLILAMIFALMTIPLIQANPVPVIAVAKQQPLPVAQGETVDVVVNVQNIGGTQIRDLELTVKDSNLFRLVSENKRVTNIGVLGTFNDYQITYTFLVDQNAPDGLNHADLVYTVGNARGETTVRLPIRVGTLDPSVSITAITSTPTPVIPGQDFEFKVALRNHASTQISDVEVSLDLDPVIAGNAILKDLPFIPLASSNKLTTQRIRPGQTSEFSFMLTAFPNARADLYKVPIQITYTDSTGTQRQLNTLSGIAVNGEPNLIVEVDQTAITKNQRFGDITFIVINTGLTDLKMTTIEILEGENFDIQSPNRLQYLGNIDSDDFDTVRYRIRTHEVDSVEIPVRINYKDSLNNDFSKETTISFEIPHASSQGNGFGTLLILLLVVAGAGYWYYKKRKNKSKED